MAGGRNGSGTFSYQSGSFPFVPQTTISSTSVNQDLTDVATALTQSICVDGQTPNVGPIKFTSGAPAFPSVTFQNDSSSGFYLIAPGNVGLAIGGTNVGSYTATSFTYAGTTFSASSFVPTGSVVQFAGASAPTGWLLCDGSAVSRTGTTATLFGVVGTTYGIGDGTTTFNLPDLRGRLVAGLDNMGGTAANRLTATTITGGATTAGNTGGDETHTLVTAELASHTHTVTDPGHTHTYVSSAASGGGNVVAGGNFGPTNTGSSTTGITNAHTGGDGAHNNVQPTMVMNMIIKV